MLDSNPAPVLNDFAKVSCGSRIHGASFSIQYSFFFISEAHLDSNGAAIKDFYTISQFFLFVQSHVLPGLYLLHALNGHTFTIISIKLLSGQVGEAGSLWSQSKVLLNFKM